MIELMDTLIHSTTAVKTINVNSGKYINFGEESNEKDCKFKVDDHVRTILGEAFVILKLKKKHLPWTNAISDVNGKEIVKKFYKKELQKAN